MAPPSSYGPWICSGDPLHPNSIGRGPDHAPRRSAAAGEVGMRWTSPGFPETFRIYAGSPAVTVDADLHTGGPWAGG